MTFHLYFEKDTVQNDYTLLYYDAKLQKESAIEMGIVSGVDMTSLNKEMTAVDWKKAFGEDDNELITLDDKATWVTEERIETIMTQLNQLEATANGKSVADLLKLKHWYGSAFKDVVGDISTIKNKPEICQRFYLPDNQSHISVDEAYRFLQNKWLEKQITARKKRIDEQHDNKSKDDNYQQSGDSRQKKKSGKKAYRRNEAEKN